MANASYSFFLQEILRGEHDLTNDGLLAAIWAAGTVNRAHHAIADMGNDLTGLTPQTVGSTSVSITDGLIVADPATITFSGVTASQTMGTLAIYSTITTSANSDPASQLNPLICGFDAGTGFGSSTQGNPIQVTFSGSGIMQVGAAP